MNIRHSLFLFICSLFMVSCSDKEERPREAVIPYVNVNEQINLSNIQYTPLRQDRGYVYLNAGVRGIIVFRHNASHYVAYERNCPYQPYDSCATVEADGSTLYFTDPCCGSKFSFDGNVISGPSRYPLLQYQTALSGNILYITN